MLRRFVSRHRRTRLARAVAGLCRSILNAYDNLNYDHDTNGERFVLEALRGRPLSCLFDVGANVGQWTMMARNIFPHSEIHCFEVMPPTVEKLRKHVEEDGKITVNSCGLSDGNGSIALRCFSGNDALTTSTDYPHDLPVSEARGEVITGDGYVQRKGIKHIDFIKIDVEGMEHQVLAGLTETLAAGKVDMVQFEYGRVNIITKFLLRDFYAFFDRHGFAVGKIYPDHVAVGDYSLEDEDFGGPNYLAVRRARGDLVRLVS
ncbi:MAG: FkbM family methyltransferase [Phycisphaerae bacterium]